MVSIVQKATHDLAWRLIARVRKGDIPQQQYFGSIRDFPKSLYIDFMVTFAGLAYLDPRL